MSKRVTAYHEAGHVVTRWALDGSLPREVIVTSTGGIVKGPGYSDQEDLHRHARAAVVCYLAGPMAEKVATGRERGRRQNREAWGDYTQAAAVIREAGLRISMKMAEREAARLLKRNWGLVERVAEALLVQGRLRQDELVKIFKRPASK